MSGGDQLSENQPEVACDFANERQSSVVVIRTLLELIEECVADPHGFVEREGAE